MKMKLQETTFVDAIIFIMLVGIISFTTVGACWFFGGLTDLDNVPPLPVHKLDYADRDYLVCLNNNCDRYLGINQLSVCENKWEEDGFGLESSCFNILDLIAKAKGK